MVGLVRVALLGMTLTFASCGGTTHEVTDREIHPSPPTDPTEEITEETADPSHTVNRIGAIEKAHEVIPGFITMTGWVNDPSGEDSVAITVHLNGDQIATLDANEQWVEGYEEKPGYGFALDFPITEGSHEVCITSAPEAAALDCIEVEVQPADGRTVPGPVVLTAITPDRFGAVFIRGVITEVAERTPSQIQVVTTVGSLIATDSTSPTGSVNIVGQAFQFQLLDLDEGRYAICPSPTRIRIYPRQLAPEDADGCGTVVIGGAHGRLNIATTGLALGTTAVGPPPDHPLYRMERDAGVSVELSDGSTLWFFGDTMMRNRDGRLRFFVHNTAVWAAVDTPLTTSDAVTAEGEPALFAAAPDGLCAGSRFSDAGLWPESAVAIAQPDGTDRVVVVMSKVCLGQQWLDIETVGYAIVEFIYDPDEPPVNTPIFGKVTQPDLASVEAGFGRAMLSHPDGFLYGYHCGEFTMSWGPCEVARVQGDQVADVNAWLFWNGGDWNNPSSWEPSKLVAAPMSMPGADNYLLPVAAFGVDYAPRLDVFLMVYTPWPGFCGQLAVRASTTPVGPWTEPLMITLPNCETDAGDLSKVCYAGTPQMQLCQGAGFAGGYFDSMTNLGVGRYLTFVSPLAVSRSAG